MQENQIHTCLDIERPPYHISLNTYCDGIQWNLSITVLRITSVIWTAINGPKRSTIETCTCLTSELRIPLYSLLWTHNLAPNGHTANSLILSRPHPRVPLLALALQFHMNHHEDAHRNAKYRDTTLYQTSFGTYLSSQVKRAAQARGI